MPLPTKLIRAYEAAVYRLLAARPSLEQLHAGAEKISRYMVSWANVRNLQDWRAAANKATRSKAVHAALRKELDATPLGSKVAKIVRENAALITSVPRQAAQTVTAEALKAKIAGQRPAAVEALIHKRLPQLVRSRVKMLARTETQKAATALNKARAEELDLQWYVWLSSQDQRTRKSHRKMDGVLVNWFDPPSPEALVGEKSTLGHYHSGEAPNCRCTQSILLNVDDVSWPARVYLNGRVTRMTKAAFLKLPINRKAA